VLAALLLALGIVLLLAGGTALVSGASQLAEKYGVPPLVVGLTVVAFGTSAPELVVNVLGSLKGESAIAFGNVAGSNLANLGLVLGTAALFTPIVIQGQLIRRELPLLLLATSVLLVMIMDTALRGIPAFLDRSESLVLLMLFGVFIYITILDFFKPQTDPLIESLSSIQHQRQDKSLISWVYVGGGLLGLVFGGNLTIDNGIKLAEAMNVPTVIVGMVVVAVGTSLPELVTSTIAAIRNEADLCLGNVIGSNIFNALLVLPVSGLIRPMEIPQGGMGDVIASMLFALMLIPIFFLRNSVMSRPMGALFVAAYVGYMGYRVLTSA
jgi:cation:H+ antiporter